MSTIDEIRKIRIEKLIKLKDLNIDPYPADVKRTHSIVQARDLDNRNVTVVGRIMAMRGHGKIYFADLVDESSKVQIVFKIDKIAEKNYTIMPLLDIGDFIEVSGKVGKTQAGEISIFTDSFKLLSKSIRPLPEKWFGLKEIEERFRKRYLDLLINPQVKKVFDARWTTERALREFLWSENYKEVETPVLQPLYGGTNAKPFTTHMNSLNKDYYLRLAPELYLKRLIVGGYERIFEIARNFRNEGIDRTHQPEFTMVEFYEAYADYHRIMDLTESLIKHIAQAVNQNYIIEIDDHKIDLSGKWKKITVDEALKHHVNIEWDKISDEELNKLIDNNQITISGNPNRNKKLFALFETLVAPKLINPTWVIDYPREVSPLSRAHRIKPDRVERFEGYVGGKEICDGWSEIISGIEQRQRFEQEQKNMQAGDTEAHPLDEEFITALEYGCPPLGGIGIGIDRLVMFITNTWAIREVIPFPTLKPLENQVIDKNLIQNKIETEIKNKITVKDLGINYSKAKELIDQYLTDKFSKLHSRESEEIMRAVAKHLGQAEEAWGIIGLLHDIDWDLTKNNVLDHTVKMVEIIKSAGGSDYLINTIQSHNYASESDKDENIRIEELKNKRRTQAIEYALTACETLTGLIIASALVQPDKKLASVKLESLLKKFKSKNFAAKCSRERIMECEKIGLTLEQFLGLGLKALQDIHEEIGL